MYTSSIAALALSGFLLSGQAQGQQPQWYQDYAQAKAVGQKENKPLAVVIGSGKQGYVNLSGTDKLTSKNQELLQNKYVVVYVDVSTQEGQLLARQFEISSGRGLVLSNRAGNLMAFHHDGSLSNEQIERYLSRFSAPDVKVDTTTTAMSARVSYYPSGEVTGNGTSNRGTSYYQPAYSNFSSFPARFGGSFSSGSC